MVPALAFCFDSKITVYQEKGRTLIFNPKGKVEVKLVEREAEVCEYPCVFYDSFLNFNATSTSE